MHYKIHLSKDKKLKKIIDKIELIEIKPKKNIFVALVSSIISQQLSTKVADVIFGRFLELMNTKNPAPLQVLAIEYDTLKSIGLSNQKTQYIINIANFAMENDCSFSYVNKLTNEELIKYLTQIKGVGTWTVEMLMMFTLARPDVYSLGDYGLQMGAKKLYNLDDANKREFLKSLEKLSEKWKPYRSYASRYLWRYKDGE
jgi:DNA-3-methyladenine glycosylase II